MTPPGNNAGLSPADERPRCLACGYDLRGHSPRARCPECGLHVAVSLAAGRSPAPPVHPLWRRQLIESAAMSLIAFALQFAAAFLVQAVFGTDGSLGASAAGVVAAGLATIVSWTLLWLSTLKLGLAARFESPSPAGVGRVAVLSALATVYAALPVWVYVAGRGFAAEASPLVALALRFTPPFAGTAFFLRLGAIFRRLGATGPAAQARLLALLIPFALFHESLSAAGFGPLETFGRVNYQHGSHAAWVELAHHFNRGEFFDVVYSALPLAVTGCGTYLVFRLMVVAARASPAWRRGGSGSPPGDGLRDVRPGTPANGSGASPAPVGKPVVPAPSH